MRSTGPKTPEGKAAVAQNRTTHALTGAFRVLPNQDREAFREAIDSYVDEYEPATPTERFLLTELAQAQWRIMRADAIEAALLSPGESATYSEIAAAFRDSDAVTRLGRYTQATRAVTRAVRQQRVEAREFERRLAEYLDAPPPTKQGGAVGIPMPPDLARERDALLARSPGFDPKRDTSQMSPPPQMVRNL